MVIYQSTFLHNRKYKPVPSVIEVAQDDNQGKGAKGVKAKDVV